MRSRAAALIVVLAMASCGYRKAPVGDALPRDTRDVIARSLDYAEHGGEITPAERAKVDQDLFAPGGIEWGALLGDAFQVVLGAALAYLGVMRARGPVTQKVGLPADLVFPARRQ